LIGIESEELGAPQLVLGLGFRRIFASGVEGVMGPSRQAYLMV
jgi:hypothetical protein